MSLLLREVKVRDFGDLVRLWTGRCGSLEQRFYGSPLAISNCVSHGGSVYVVIQDPDLEGIGKVVGSIVLEAGMNLVGRFFVAPSDAIAKLLIDQAVQTAVTLFYPRVIVARVVIPQDRTLAGLGCSIESGELPGELYAVREITDSERHPPALHISVERTSC